MRSAHYDYEEIQSSRLITDLVFPSGGSRYIFFFGALAALAKTGVLEKVNRVSGTSAGAIFATMVALGANPNEIYLKYAKTDLFQLFGERVGSLLGGNAEGISPITKDGKPLIDKMQEIIADLMKSFLATNEVILLINDYPELAELNSRFQQPNATLSFNDIKFLKQLFPTQFKELFYATATFPKGKPYVLNIDSTHNDIAEGCYASGAIPGVLNPKKIGDQLLIDGGVYKQMPFDVFDFPQPNQHPEQTLVFAFTDPSYVAYEETASYKALYRDHATKKFYEPHFLEQIARDHLMPFAIGLQADYKNTESWDENYSDLAKSYPLNTVEINVCGLFPPDFSSALKYSRQFYSSAFLDTMNYLTNHELYINECETQQFYENLMTTFECIYKAALDGAKINLKYDKFWNDYINYKNKASEKNIISFLHDHLKANLESIPALALAYTIEFDNNVLTADQLFKDVYQLAFDNSTPLTQSNVLGYTVYSSQALKEGLRSFSLFNSNNNYSGDRSNIVLKNLLFIPKFQNKYEVELLNNCEIKIKKM